MSDDQLFGEGHFDVGLAVPAKLPVKFRLLVPYMHTTPSLPAGTILELATNDSLGYTRGAYAFEHNGILYSISADDCELIAASEWTGPQEHLAVTSKKKEGKLQVSLLRDFSLAMTEVARALTYGAVKHGAHNWTTLPIEDIPYYEDAADRHDLHWWSGEVIDKDSGCMHEAQVICCRLITLELKLRAARAAREGETK